MYQKRQVRDTNIKNGPETKYGVQGKPESEGEVKEGISLKAMKYLPKSSYSIKADPYTAALPTSEPYPLLNRFNRAIGGNFKGEDNIDGGNVQQYAQSATSKMLKYFDVFRMKAKVNYRYLPIVADLTVPRLGAQLVNEMRKSIAETVSILKSTTFTQMAINEFAVVTDMAMGDAQTENVSFGGVENTPAYTDLTDVLYAMSIMYQIILQEGVNVINYHNAFRLKMGSMIRNSWNRETPILKSLFGNLNKKAWLSLMLTFAGNFEGEYVDKDFMQQVNMISVAPSRRSNSITDPVLECQVNFQHPTTFRVYARTAPQEYGVKVFDLDDLKYLWKAASGDEPAVYKSYFELAEELTSYMTQEATTLWARVNRERIGSNGRFDTMKKYLDGLNMCFNVFKPAWSDFREAFDTVSRTGVISWSKGFVPAVTKLEDCASFRNLIVDDMFVLRYAGAKDIYFNNDTKRWRTFSLWNMYTGVPEYDIKSGGVFLLASYKDFVIASDDDNNIEYMPVAFYEADDFIVGVSRDGKEVQITRGRSRFDSQLELKRLAPLASQNSLMICYPYIQRTEEINTDIDDEHLSTLVKTAVQIFGVARILNSYYVDSDILAIYNVEIDDVTNEATTYMRANAPFRGTASDQGNLGFFGLDK